RRYDRAIHELPVKAEPPEPGTGMGGHSHRRLVYRRGVFLLGVLPELELGRQSVGWTSGTDGLLCGYETRRADEAGRNDGSRWPDEAGRDDARRDDGTGSSAAHTHSPKHPSAIAPRIENTGSAPISTRGIGGAQSGSWQAHWDSD